MVYGSPGMSRWSEGVLAVVIVLVFGLGMYLYAAEGSSAPGSGSGTTVPVEVDPAAVTRGEAAANGAGCLICHSVDGSSGTGPTFKGLYGSSRPLTTGEFVTADDSYLLTSIIDPEAQVVEGFDPVMPAEFESMLTTEEIEDIVAFIKSLAS